MKKEGFEDLFQQTLEELCDAERQIVQAMPKMIASCSSAQLSGALQSHLDETRQQLVRLESILELAGEESAGKESKGMHGVLEESDQILDDLERSPVRDVALIAAAAKVEHCEIAAYGSACAIAEVLGQQEIFRILQDILAEERNASDTLAELAKSILGGDGAGQTAAG
jgi:ferritin-like metal-binding protein YciE